MSLISTPRGWTNLDNVDWDCDGKALLVSSISPTGTSLLRVDMASSAQLLWTKKGAAGTFAMPSRDCRYLTLTSFGSGKNVWMASF